MTNADLEKIVDTSDEWIRERTGIEQRRIAADNQTTCDLAYEASIQAMEMAGIQASDLDLIIVATTTPDKIFPSTATLLQQRLNNHGAPAFDVQAVCTGFVYALSIADQFMQTGMSKKALVVGAETLSRITNWEDRNTCVLFGDGAAQWCLKPPVSQAFFLLIFMLMANMKNCFMCRLDRLRSLLRMIFPSVRCI